MKIRLWQILILILPGAAIYAYASYSNSNEIQVLNKYYFYQNGTVYFKDNNPAFENQPVALKKANPTHFRILTDNNNLLPVSESYLAADCLNVYYKNQVLQGANPSTFSILSNGFTKDDKRVFFNEISLPKANSETFEVLGNLYAKDHQSIWFGNTPANASEGEIHFSSFEIIDGYFSKDKHRVYANNKQSLVPLKHIKPGEFKKLKRNNNHKYNNFIIYASANKIHIKDRIKDNHNSPFFYSIEADTASFEILNQDYFKDSANIFFRNRKLPGVRLPSFQILDNNYSKDSATVFYKHIVLPDAQSKYFETLSTDTTDAKDSLYYYHRGNKLETKQ